jgi:hypothetical protein
VTARRTQAPATAAAATARPTALVVMQVRHALQQAGAIGAASAARFTRGSIRAGMRVTIPRRAYATGVGRRRPAEASGPRARRASCRYPKPAVVSSRRGLSSRLLRARNASSARTARRGARGELEPSNISAPRAQAEASASVGAFLRNPVLLSGGGGRVPEQAVHGARVEGALTSGCGLGAIRRPLTDWPHAWRLRQLRSSEPLSMRGRPQRGRWRRSFRCDARRFFATVFFTTLCFAAAGWVTGEVAVAGASGVRAPNSCDQSAAPP